jgi:hypothetical protein
MSDDTRAKLLGHGKRLLHFVCSNALALVLLPIVAWAVVSAPFPAVLLMHALSSMHDQRILPPWLP